MITLYKKDTKGKIRVLKVGTDESNLIQISGMLNADGEINKPVSHIKECKPKNVGKSNATTAETQAIAEMHALVTIKLTEGYFNTVEEAKNEEVLMPMLAKVYENEEQKINWEGDVFIQPKLDGMRCLATVADGKVELISRTGKVIDTMGHIEAELAFFPDGIYDGELYAHGISFQENMKLIKKLRPESNTVKYHIYDKVSDKPFIERFTEVAGIMANLGEMLNAVERVYTYRITHPEIIGTIHSDNLLQGYEGSMIRHGDEGYKVNGRADQLLKYKQFQDIAAEIIDIEPADARPEWGTPVLRYTNRKLTGVNTFTFKAGVKMSHDDRKDLLSNKDKYIGKTAEIRFFEYTDDGLPRFPVMVGIRLDK